MEVAAALARRDTARHAVPVAVLQAQLTAEWNAMLQFEINGAVFEQAALIAWEQKLRGADAIHLAAASQLRDQAARRSLDLVLVTADAELIRAATEFELVVTNPAELT